MFNELDELDGDCFDDLPPPVTKADRPSGKFRPKTRSKPVKAAVAAPKTSVATGIIPAPVNSVAPDLNANHGFEHTSLSPNLPTVGSEPRSTQESEQQSEVIQAESSASKVEFIQHSQQSKKDLVQDTDLFSSLNSSNGLSTTAESGSLDDYQQKAHPQSENKQLMMSPTVEPEVEESLCASILAELNEAQLPPRPEEVISLEASLGDVDAQDSDMTMQSNLDKSKQVLVEFPDVESPTSLHPNGSIDVAQVGKFQPKKGKLCKKEAKSKSVSFILPDAVHSAAHVKSFPGKMVSSSMQVMTDRPVDNLPSSLNSNSDMMRELQLDHGRMENENRQENRLPIIMEDVSMEPQCQDFREFEQQILDAQTIRENDEDGAGMPSMTLIEQGSQNDDRQADEDMPRPKRAKRKSKKQTTEIEKPARQRKKVSDKSKSAVEDSSKKNFPHSTRRKKRQVDKVLLLTPEEEIDPKQISLKNLIMLAEAKERIAAKEGDPSIRLFSNNSTSYFSNAENFGEDESMLFGEDEALNQQGEENQNIQEAPKKLNYHTYMKRSPSTRWSKSDTELLYEALRQFGSDFEMIQHLFPNRTRHQIKLKFKIEERKHPKQIHDALLHRSKDYSHVMQVIEQLQANKPEPTADGEENTDQMNTSQDGVGKDEEETGGSQIDEEHQHYGRQGDDKGEEFSIDSKGGADDLDANDDGSIYDWDSGAYKQDDNEDPMWVI